MRFDLFDKILYSNSNKIKEKRLCMEIIELTQLNYLLTARTRKRSQTQLFYIFFLSSSCAQQSIHANFIFRVFFIHFQISLLFRFVWSSHILCTKKHKYFSCMCDFPLESAQYRYIDENGASCTFEICLCIFYNIQAMQFFEIMCWSICQRRNNSHFSLYDQNMICVRLDNKICLYK